MPEYNWRDTHSAFPTDDGQYVLTTDELLPFPEQADPLRQGAFLRAWKISEIGTATSLKAGYYVPETQERGITTIASISNYAMSAPNSIHQLFIRGSKAHIAHYTQGFRLLDISNIGSSNPDERLVEEAYYDDFEEITTANYQNNWYNGIFGVYPDPNRPNIVYGGSFQGFHVFSVRNFRGALTVN